MHVHASFFPNCVKIQENVYLIVDNFRLGSISKYRIDGRKINTIWTFSNDQPIIRFYWYPGEPADNVNSIGLRVGYSGEWDDIKPSILHGCICEKDIKFN